MIKINIKPLSVNRCWQGRRFRTPTYNAYEKEVMYKLPRVNIPEPPFKMNMVVGVSSKLFDIDNALKPWIDILQKKYNFNDRDIFELHVKKEIVPKGKEYIKFGIYSIKH